MLAEFEPNNTIFPLEQKRISNIVQTFKEAGYEYEVKATHGDVSDGIHFRRHLRKKPYPHFHLIYDFSEEKFTLHLDTRKHRAIRFSPDLSEELERLYVHFTAELDPHKSTTYGLISSLAKQAITLAMFSSPDQINSNRFEPKTKLQKKHKRWKLKKSNKQKYRRKKDDTATKVEYDGVIEEWEPLSLEV